MIWQAITERTFMHMGTRRVIKTQAEYNTLLIDVKDIPQHAKDKMLSYVKAMRIIRFDLPRTPFA